MAYRWVRFKGIQMGAFNIEGYILKGLYMGPFKRWLRFKSYVYMAAFKRYIDGCLLKIV